MAWPRPILLCTLGVSWDPSLSGTLRTQVLPDPGFCDSRIPGAWRDRVSCLQVLKPLNHQLRVTKAQDSAQMPTSLQVPTSLVHLCSGLVLLTAWTMALHPPLLPSTWHQGPVCRVPSQLCSMPWQVTLQLQRGHLEGVARPLSCVDHPGRGSVPDTQADTQAVTQDHARTLVHMHAHAHLLLCSFTHTHTLEHMCRHILSHSCTYVCMLVCLCTHLHVYWNTYTHAT